MKNVIKVLLGLAILESSAMAATWNQGVVGNWNVPSNWDTSSVPTSTENVYLNWSGTTVVGNGVIATAKSLYIGYNDANLSPILNVTGGSLTIGTGDGFWGLTIGYGGQTTGTMNISGGVVHALGNMMVAQWGTGTLNVTGGELDIDGVFVLSQQNVGYTNLDGGLIKCGAISNSGIGHMNVTQGKFAVSGYSISSIQALITAGNITAYNGNGRFYFDYNNINPGYTTVWAEIPPPGAAPTLDDFWAGTAKWRLANYSVGDSFGFHFPSMIWEGSEIWAYYIKHQYNGSTFVGYAIGRARSTDGINWTDDGFVQKVGGEAKWSYTAQSLSHQVGRTDGDGWSADPTLDPKGYMCYGPYTTAISQGWIDAQFTLMTNNKTGTTIIATLEVYDATSNVVLATKSLKRNDFTAINTYQTFHLNANVTAANHSLEFRTYFKDLSWIKEQGVAVAQDQYPHWDDYTASFPGIYKDGSTWNLVYEGSRQSGGTWAGDLGLSTSSDGLNFYRSSTNPILQNGSGWESVNIGTPSITKSGSTWYLYYHGYNGVDCQIGVATGSNILALVKQGLKIPTLSGTWEAGTCGKRSRIIQSGVSGLWYMAYEGSTDQPYDTANWSTGLARSSDKLNWSKYSGNPIVPVVQNSMGNDGPEMIIISGEVYLYVRSTHGGSDRYRLEWK